MKQIAVIGPLPGQQRVIAKRFPNTKFVFIGSDEKAGKAFRAISHCDGVVVWTSFMSHKHLASARKEQAVIRYASGGMSSVMREIESFITNTLH